MDLKQNISFDSRLNFIEKNIISKKFHFPFPHVDSPFNLQSLVNSFMTQVPIILKPVDQNVSFTHLLSSTYFAQTLICFPKMSLTIRSNFLPVQSKEDHFWIEPFYRQSTPLLPFLIFIFILVSVSKI